MGESAKFNGEEIKIGTCEDMYYLRLDQRWQVRHISGNVDVLAQATELRFRFPWPDEDRVLPGSFERYDRSVAVWGYAMPDGVNHGTVQFRADAGYLLSIPCPESPMGKSWPQVHRNGFRGAVLLTQVKLLADGRVVPVLECGGCGAKWREENPDEIVKLARYFREEGDAKRRKSGDGRWWTSIAERLLVMAKLEDRRAKVFGPSEPEIVTMIPVNS